MKNQKVFGIGFHKTGTSTLNQVLKILGYKVMGNRTDLAQKLINGEKEIVLNELNQFDACEDTPWPISFKELDKKYPKSKFILTVREEESWYKSIENHFGNQSTLMREWIYGEGEGDPVNNKSRYINRYKKHNEEVLEYFNNRKKDLLVINWKENSNWKYICDFLNAPIPQKQFPHANKGAYTQKEKKLKNIKLFIYRNILKPFGY
jgi:hypothetical protein